MIVVLVMAGTLWAIGAAMGAPKRARWIMIGVLFTAVILLHLILPDGHPLREGTGGSAAFWALLAGFVAIGVLYSRGLRWLRGRVQPPEPDPATTDPAPKLREVELERYARHIILREIGGPGQKALKEARVLVIGAGGLGAPVLQYLAAAGVGTIGVIDDDVVDHTNLQRQVIHRDDMIGTPKVFSAQSAMEALNPYLIIKPYNRRLTEDLAQDLFSDFDLIIDGTDNFATRRLVNRAAVASGLPLVSGALTQWEGQISVFAPSRNAPCYDCIFPNDPAPGMVPSCAEAGVVGPLPGVVGAMMAVEAVKMLTGAGTPLLGAMMIYDALDAETRRIKVTRRADCATCGAA